MSCALSHLTILVILWDAAKTNLSNYVNFLKSETQWLTVEKWMVDFQKQLTFDFSCRINTNSYVKRITFANQTTFKSWPNFESQTI